MKHRILLKGPFLSLSGYGHQARFALDSIRSRTDLFDIFIENVGWGNTSWTVDQDLREWIEEKIKKTLIYFQNGGQFDVQMQVTVPNEIEPVAPVNILYTAGIETTHVSPQWLQKSNTINKLIVVSNHAKNVFESTSYEQQNQRGQTVGELKCEVPIDVVNYPVEDVEPVDVDLDLDYDFNFLTMAQWGPRKDLDNLIRLFYEEFWEDEVGLVVKTFLANNSLSDRMNVKNRLKLITDSIPLDKDDKKCKVYLLHGSMKKEELHGLYNNENISAFVTTTHGEGYGLSLFESAYNGLPVIAPNWSGQTDFLYKDSEKLFTDIKFLLKPVNKEAVWPGVIEENSSWCFVLDKDAKKKMRSVYDDLASAEEKADELEKYIHNNFTSEKKHAEFVEAVTKVLPDDELSDDELDAWLNDMGVDLIEAD